jgi:hypothetical protein
MLKCRTVKRQNFYRIYQSGHGGCLVALTESDFPLSTEGPLLWDGFADSTVDALAIYQRVRTARVRARW